MFEPGRCNVAGTLVGAATIGMLGNGLVLMGAEYYVQDIMLGVIIVASVALSASTLQEGRIQRVARQWPTGRWTVSREGFP